MLLPTPIESVVIKNYIDAGVGGLFIQVLIAGSIGALFYFRAYLKRAKAYLSNLLARARKGRK